MPKVSDAHREETRRQIAAGAATRSGEHGYAGATVEVLEREIGLSRGAIFSYFPSKLDLFVAPAQEDQRRLIDLSLERRLGGRGAARRRGRPGVDRGVPRRVADAAHRSRARDRWRSLNPEGQAALEARYRGPQESGEIRDDVPLETFGRFLGIVFDGIAGQQAARFGSRIDVDGTLELLRSALRPK